MKELRLISACARSVLLTLRSKTGPCSLNPLEPLYLFEQRCLSSYLEVITVLDRDVARQS